jgi:hypothetical protein
LSWRLRATPVEDETLRLTLVETPSLRMVSIASPGAKEVLPRLRPWDQEEAGIRRIARIKDKPFLVISASLRSAAPQPRDRPS